MHQEKDAGGGGGVMNLTILGSVVGLQMVLIAHQQYERTAAGGRQAPGAHTRRHLEVIGPPAHSL